MSVPDITPHWKLDTNTCGDITNDDTTDSDSEVMIHMNTTPLLTDSSDDSCQEDDGEVFDDGCGRTLLGKIDADRDECWNHKIEVVNPLPTNKGHCGGKIRPICENNEGAFLLVIDIDDTIVHTTETAQTAREECRYLCPVEFHRRPFKEISFDGEKITTPEYFTVVRPGVVDALRVLSANFTLAICTLGCRHYAEVILGALDPDASLFGQRVWTREYSPENVLVKDIPSWWGWEPRRAIIIDDMPEVWNAFGDYTIIRISKYDGGGDEVIDGLPVFTKLSKMLVESLETARKQHRHLHLWPADILVNIIPEMVAWNVDREISIDTNLETVLDTILTLQHQKANITNSQITRIVKSRFF